MKENVRHADELKRMRVQLAGWRLAFVLALVFALVATVAALRRPPPAPRISGLLLRLDGTTVAELLAKNIMQVNP